MYNPAPHVPQGKDQVSALLGWAVGPGQGGTFSEPWPRLYDGRLGLSTAGVVVVTAPVLGSSGPEVTSGWESAAQATQTTQEGHALCTSGHGRDPRHTGWPPQDRKEGCPGPRVVYTSRAVLRSWALVARVGPPPSSHLAGDGEELGTRTRRRTGPHPRVRVEASQDP